MSVTRRKRHGLSLNLRSFKNSSDMRPKNYPFGEDVVYANTRAREYYDSDYNPLPLSVIELNEVNPEKIKKGYFLTLTHGFHV